MATPKSRKERREIHFKDFDRAKPAMWAAVDAKAYDAAAEVAEICQVMLCPVCVHTHGLDVFGQKVTYNGKAFWICKSCTAKYVGIRNTKAPVPLDIHSAFAAMYGSEFKSPMPTINISGSGFGNKIRIRQAK